MTYVDITAVSIPPNSEIYIDSVKELIEFKLLNLEDILSTFGIIFSFKDFIKGINYEPIVSKYQDKSVSYDLSIYVLALVWMFTVLFLSSFFLTLCCHFKPLKTLFTRFK